MAPRSAAVLVVGGAGFVGSHVVQLLLASGQYSVRVLDSRAIDPDVVAAGTYQLFQIGASVDPTLLADACDGCLAVYVCNATFDTLGVRRVLQRDLDAAVATTSALVTAAAAKGVSTIVMASSTATCWDLDRHEPLLSEEKARDRASVASRATQAMQQMERVVLHGNRELHDNGTTRMTTGVVRAAGMVYGERCDEMLDQIRCMVYDGALASDRHIQQTYVGNVAHAMHRLSITLNEQGFKSDICGEAYFVSDHDGAHYAHWAAPLFQGAPNVPNCRLGRIGAGSFGFQASMRRFASSLGLRVRPFPNVLVAKLVMHDHTVSSSLAEAQFQYQAVVTREEALDRTKQWITSLSW